jgi:hypothetical protein
MEHIFNMEMVLIHISLLFYWGRQIISKEEKQGRKKGKKEERKGGKKEERSNGVWGDN